MKKTTRRLCALFLAIVLLVGLAVPVGATAAREISVVLDGAPITFDVAPRLTNNRTMVPVRAIFEALGAEVEWNNATHTVTATAANGDVIALTLGSTTLSVNGTASQMDVAPFATGGRTLAPVRFVAEAMGVDVQWDPATWTVLLTSSGNARVLGRYDMTFRLASTAGITVRDFHLGNGTVTDWAGNPHEAPLAGVIAVPNTPGPHPLVVILHGNANNFINFDIHGRVYSGFAYLARQLAAEGYVAISININIEYSDRYGESSWGSYAYAIFEQHLERLVEANTGQNTAHGVNLIGMVDFDEIHLIGHSRGGELADTFVRRDQAAEIDRIRSIIRVAPTVSPYWLDDAAAPHPDIPVGIILPEFDGDVQSLDGQSVFDEVRDEARNRSMVSLIYLRGANHNFFNSFLVADDAHWYDFAQGRQIPRAAQEDFLMRYAAAFLSITAQNRTPWGTFSATEPQPTTMFGHEAIASTYISGLRSALAAPVQNVPAATATGSATATFYEQRMNDPEGFFSHPGVFGRENPRLPLYDLQWMGTDGAVSFALLDGNFANHQALSLYVAIDSSNARNPEGQNQAFTVTLTDNTGATRSVTIPRGAAPLTWHPGEVEAWFGEYTWVGHMPLADLRIPLTYFAGLNLSAITGLTITFDQTPAGAVMLSGIYLK